MNLLPCIEAQSAMDQLTAFRAKGMPVGGKILNVEGISESLIFNPSIPFRSDDAVVMAVRTDPGLTHPCSKTRFCLFSGDVLRPVEGAPVLDLEDPFVTIIKGQIVLGGVRLIWKDGAVDAWVTDFYEGDSIFSLRYLFSGPRHMKDIRLVGLADGRIGVFSRPQGQAMLDRYGCIAQIGFTVADRLEDITPELIEAAPFLQGLFLPDEWGGVNQAILLKNGLVGVVGHKAWGEHADGVHTLHYYSMAFALDPVTARFTEPEILCARECFEPGPAAEPRLRDVTFTAGIVRGGGGKADLYTGLSDMQIGRISIGDPFMKYEEASL